MGDDATFAGPLGLLGNTELLDPREPRPTDVVSVAGGWTEAAAVLAGIRPLNRES